MKTISQNYKDQIKILGREITTNVTYSIGGTTYTLNDENLNNVSLHYNGGILKSVMKQLDIDSNTDIPLGTQINAQFGLKVNGIYEYINLGNFIVYSSEKQEDLNSYKIVCYDKLLYSMKDYESFATYPITIRDYINDLCSHIGLTFANSNDTFVNYDKTIESELFLDADGNSLNYTFRDVLSQLAQVTASTICINNYDELEVRYINNTNDTIDEEYLKDVNVNFGEHYGAVNTISFKRGADADVISKSIPENLPDNEKIEISISDNQILNGNDRDDFIDEILNELYGLEYYTNDFKSTGITYYELCDKYNVLIGENTYPCIMFNDEINITQGLEELVHTERPDESITNYQTATKTDRTRTRTELIVDKVNGQINALVSTTDDLENRIDTAEGRINSQGAKLDLVSTNIDEEGNITALKRTNYELGQDGFIIDDEKGYRAVRNTTGDYYYENDVMKAKLTKDEVVIKDMALFGKYYYGIEETLDVENFSKDDAMFVAQLYEDKDGEECFGHFYNGS